MGKVIISEFTTKNPITMIGKCAGICWGADTSDDQKNYARGIDCLENEHGRTFEFPDVYMALDEYSARVIREWYTHIGGSPTRLQSSTRYIDYSNFNYVMPKTISENPTALAIYDEAMQNIRNVLAALENLGVPREDSALLLPLGMTTKVFCKHNLRNLIDMSHQRLCQRAYHEYQTLFKDLMKELRSYSEEWAYLVDHYFMPKCKYMGFCKEKKTCKMMPRRK